MILGSHKNRRHDRQDDNYDDEDYESRQYGNGGNYRRNQKDNGGDMNVHHHKKKIEDKILSMFETEGEDLSEAIDKDSIETGEDVSKLLLCVLEGDNTEAQVKMLKCAVEWWAYDAVGKAMKNKKHNKGE